MSGRAPLFDAPRHAPIAAQSSGRRVFHLRRDRAEMLVTDPSPWEKVLGYCDPGGRYIAGNAPEVTP